MYDAGETQEAEFAFDDQIDPVAKPDVTEMEEAEGKVAPHERLLESIKYRAIATEPSAESP